MYFVNSANNSGVIFNDRLRWSNQISVTLDRVYEMLRILWAALGSTPLFGQIVSKTITLI